MFGWFSTVDKALNPVDWVDIDGLLLYLSNDQLIAASPLVDALEKAKDSAAESSDCLVDPGEDGILETISWWWWLVKE